MSSRTSYTVGCGLAVLNPKPMVRLISNPEPESWTKTLMAYRNTLGDRIRRGEFRSAWDDYETEADAFAGRTSAEKVAHNAKVEEDMKRYRREQEEARRAQEERLRIAAEQEAQRKADEAQEALENLEGFGSF
jgi:hypothetical protein